jgi:serine phosphatase RsbU (regulator of sigma subunit)
MSDPKPAVDGGALRSLLRESHLLSADQLGSAVADRSRLLGAREAVVYLVDYAQDVLVPLPDDRGPRHEPQPVDGSDVGRAFRRVEVLLSSGPDGGTVQRLPLLDGGERVGVLEVVWDQPPAGDREEEIRAFAALVAELVVTRSLSSDVFDRLRRRRPLSLAAEIQWELLPPLTFVTEHVVITGLLEPAYQIGGDTFDYAVNGDTADLIVLDAMGHGLPAALLAGAALGAYRHARRAGGSLVEISAAMDAVIAENFRESRFATALLARLDLPTGRFSWVAAGHPAPLLVRDGALVHPSACTSSLPLGLQREPAVECETWLQTADRVLLYTDGVVEARSADGQFFGEERLGEFVVRAEAAGDSPPETLRRLKRSVREHQAGRLQDDASIVLVEWRTGREQQVNV